MVEKEEILTSAIIFIICVISIIALMGISAIVNEKGDSNEINSCACER